jgi:hypothetical protein
MATNNNEITEIYSKPAKKVTTHSLNYYGEGYTPLPYLKDIYKASFTKHPQKIQTGSIKVAIVFKKIIDMIDFYEGLYPEDIVVKKHPHNPNVYYVCKHTDKNKTETLIEYKIMTSDEVKEELEGAINDDITCVDSDIVFKHLLPEYRQIVATMTIPEKTYDNDMCCVCLEGYDNNKKITSCGHTLCEGCFEGIMSSTNKRCPECRSSWTNSSSGYSLEDIEAMYEGEGDVDELPRIIDIPELVNECWQMDYLRPLGYGEEDVIDVFDEFDADALEDFYEYEDYYWVCSKY